MTLSQQLKKVVEKDQPTEKNLNEWTIKLYTKLDTKTLKIRQK